MNAKPETINVYDPALFFEFRDLSLKMAKKPLVLFFGRKTFSDNTKYLFLACVRDNPDFEVKWCTWDENLHDTLEKHGLPSLLITRDFQTTTTLCLEAAVAVFCENTHTALRGVPVLRGCLAGSKKIQLWHGISVKRLDLMIVREMNLLDKGFRANCIGASDIDCVASTSSKLDSFWVKAFGTRHILRVGQPRNEVIVRTPHAEEFIGAMLSPTEEAVFASSAIKVLIAPTWQRAHPHWISTDEFHATLETLGKKNNIFFCIKQHPFSAVNPKTGKSNKRYEHVFFLDAGFDVYPWMNSFAALITDYSSIMFDFILTHKPVLTYEIPNHKKLSFEPDYNLVPNSPFTYEFNEKNLESELLMSIQSHPNLTKQKTMIEALYETEPSQSSANLINFLDQVVHDATDSPFQIQNL
jgi:CDP-glycerol glycerophosphotransferase (TagB/SpsB family)